MNIELALQKSKAYLSTPEALQSIERDPYWPKWDSPWWHMLLLHEMGQNKEIPEAAVSKMVNMLKQFYLRKFYLDSDPLPRGADPARHVICHCAVGCMYQVLFSCGVNVNDELPWMRPWLLSYQMSDGGLNCDQEGSAKSSIVSTVPCLEAILFCRNGNLTSDEIAFLDRGAQYLLRHRLFRRESTGEIIDENWLRIRFPRFYEYDFLRGYRFLAKWRDLSGLPIPDDLVDEVEGLISSQEIDGKLILTNASGLSNKSYSPIENGKWEWGKSTEFELLTAVRTSDQPCGPLTKQWNEVRPKSAIVKDSYQTIYKNPIQLRAGELVKIEKRETAPEWQGWVFCIDSRGIGGWVSEHYLSEEGDKVVVKQDYDATELTLVAGEKIRVYYEEFGWCWARSSEGIRGWIPTKNLIIDRTL